LADIRQISRRFRARIALPDGLVQPNSPHREQKAIEAGDSTAKTQLLTQAVGVAGERLRAGRIFSNAGGRALVPAMPGINEVPYLTIRR